MHIYGLISFNIIMGEVQATATSRWEEDVLKSKIPVLVDFWAEWCGPCRMVAPVIEELAKEYEGKIKFLKLNVDENQDIAMKYQIYSIPTLLLFKDGKIIGQHIGATSKDVLKRFIENSLQNA
ncbi:MAG: thioredoxin [Candidatus Nitrosocaldaceae archaeon]|jgi:thioredoxin 1|nr:MAG: thioredoxin [Candidatus Nitrosocaldaceae archaeon]